LPPITGIFAADTGFSHTSSRMSRSMTAPTFAETSAWASVSAVPGTLPLSFSTSVTGCPASPPAAFTDFAQA
jgi:hypothetical protein